MAKNKKNSWYLLDNNNNKAVNKHEVKSKSDKELERDKMWVQLAMTKGSKDFWAVKLRNKLLGRLGVC